jgi:hypothetical protein
MMDSLIYGRRLSGGGQAGSTDQLLNPVVVQLLDSSLTPVAGVTVTFAAPVGAAVTPSTAVTSALGRATFAARLGRAVGSDAFTATAPGTPTLTMTMGATTPATGTIFTILNADHAVGNDGIPGAGTAAHTGGLQAMAIASDGTVYVADSGNNYVDKLTPHGQLTHVAGNGVASNSGDNGLATAAGVPSPRGLALDASNGILYIAQPQTIRAVTLSTGIISTIAGGGSAPGPAFGDGGPATAAAFSSLGWIGLGPDGALYVNDTGNYRYRRIDSNTGIITSWLARAAVNPCTTALEFSEQNGGGGNIVWDSAGNAFLGAGMCGTTLLPYGAAAGVLRRTPGGILSRIAGVNAGSLADNIVATSAGFLSAPMIAMDHAGNIFTADSVDHRVRRIEAGNGRITTVAENGGGGYAGDYVPANLSQLYTPPRSPSIRSRTST